MAVIINKGNIFNYFKDYILYEDYNKNVDDKNGGNTLYKANFLQNSMYVLKNKDEEQNNIDKIQWEIARNRLITAPLFSSNFNNILDYSGLPENLLPVIYIPFYQSSEDIAASTNFNLLTLDDNLPDDFYIRTFKDWPQNIVSADNRQYDERLPDPKRIAEITIQLVNDVYLNYNVSNETLSISVKDIIKYKNASETHFTSLKNVYTKSSIDNTKSSLDKIKDAAKNLKTGMPEYITDIIATVVYYAVLSTIGSSGVAQNVNDDAFTRTSGELNAVNDIKDKASNGSYIVKQAVSIANSKANEDYNYVMFAACSAAAYILIGKTEKEAIDDAITYSNVMWVKRDNSYVQKRVRFKKDLQDLLHNQIKNLNDPTKTYNNFDLTTMIIFVCILWFVIILTLLKIVYYYYSEYYSIIIIIMTVLMLITAIIWKMSNIIRS